MSKQADLLITVLVLLCVGSIFTYGYYLSREVSPEEYAQVVVWTAELPELEKTVDSMCKPYLSRGGYAYIQNTRDKLLHERKMQQFLQELKQAGCRDQTTNKEQLP